MRTLGIAAALCLLASSARAERPAITATLGLTDQVVTERAFDLVSSRDHLPLFRVGAGYGFEVLGGRLDLEAVFRTGSTHARAHGAGDMDLSLVGLEAAVAYRYPLARFFEPYVRLGLGHDWATLHADLGGLVQTSGSLVGTGMVGFALPIVATTRAGVRHTWLVVDLGGGYALRPGFAFDQMRPATEKKPGPDAPQTTPIDLGTLPMSGFVWQLGFTVRL